jgi:hypothetical protein
MEYNLSSKEPKGGLGIEVLEIKTKVFYVNGFSS